MNPTTAPLYFLAPETPAIETYRTIFSGIDKFETSTLSLNIHYALVKEKNTTMVQQIIMALQHYPYLIHKLLFSIEFTFSEAEGSNLHIAKRIWKRDVDYYQWFNRLTDLPFMLFFIHDEDARYYALMGDIIANGEVQIDHLPGHGIPALPLTTEQLQILQNRLFHSCLSLLVFCHGSGFNPVIYIQGLIAFFDASFTYEDVLCEYANDVLKGTFRITCQQEPQE